MVRVGDRRARSLCRNARSRFFLADPGANVGGASFRCPSTARATGSRRPAVATSMVPSRRAPMPRLGRCRLPRLARQGHLCAGRHLGRRPRPGRAPLDAPEIARRLPSCSDTPPDGRPGGKQPLPAPRITIAYVGAHARALARPHRRRRRRDVHGRRAPVRLGRGAGAQGALDPARLRQGRRRRRARPARLRRVVAEVVHGTTVATNAVLEKLGARTRDRHDPGLSRRARAAPDADAAPVRLLLEEATAARPAPAALRGRGADVGCG